MQSEPLGRPAASALGATLILTGAALAYPFWYQVSGPAHYVGPAWPINNPWYADALDFVAPSPRQAVAPVLRSVGTALSAPTGVENGAYIGVAVLAILVFLVWHQQTSQTRPTCSRTCSGLRSAVPGPLPRGRQTRR